MVRRESWAACTGATKVDTQALCADGCDVNYYQSKDPDTERSTCTLCQQCTDGDIYGDI